MSAMESWQDQGIILAVRPHGENGAVVSLLTQGQGRFAGYVRGAHSSKLRGTLEIGNRVDANWAARVADSLGTLQLELCHSPAARIMQDASRLAALQSACALSHAALPEREGHAGLFHGLNALFEALESDVWAEAYVMWEIAFLRELGFSLDLTKCAASGDTQDLSYVSPKTGRAVSRSAGAPYKERLLPLAGFLRPEGGAGGSEDVEQALRMTGYFLEHWAFAHHTQGVPEARRVFQERYEAAGQRTAGHAAQEDSRIKKAL